MATITLYPSSLQNNPGTLWSFIGGAADYSVLQDANGDNSYALVGDTINGALLRLGMDDLPSLGAATIDALETEYRLKNAPAETGGSLKTGFSNAAGDGPALLTERVALDTYRTFTEVSATDANGAAWTEALVNAGSAVIKKIAGGAATGVRVTFVWWNVEYTITGTPGAGGSMAFMSGILLPLVGVGLTWGQMAREVGPYLRAHRLRIRLSKQELRGVYEDLKAHKRRVYFVLS